MTDSEFLLEQLADGREHTLTDLLRASIDQRGHGLTVHSRVSDLRAAGHKIEHVTIPGAQRGAGHAYRLASLPQPGSLPSPIVETGSETQDPGNASDADLTLFGDPRPSAYRHDVAA